MEPLTSRELRAALDTLQAIGAGCAGPEDFARRGVACLPDLIGSELTTLSTCDLDTGHRTVVSDHPGAISRREIEVFDHYFHVHPLVREHGRNPAAVTRRIDDLLPDGTFRRTPLFNEYYRKIGIDHAMAVPIHVDGRFLVSFVLNRSGTGFSDRDRDLAETHAAASREPVPARRGARGRAHLPSDAPFDPAAAPSHRARARGARLGGGGQDQPRHRRDPRREPAHRREAPRAHLREAGRGNAHRRGGARRNREARQLNARYRGRSVARTGAGGGTFVSWIRISVRLAT